MKRRMTGRIRRDKKRRILPSGESVRIDGKYQFKYMVDGKPKFFYSWKLEPTDPLPPRKKALPVPSGDGRQPGGPPGDLPQCQQRFHDRPGTGPALSASQKECETKHIDQLPVCGQCPEERALFPEGYWEGKNVRCQIMVGQVTVRRKELQFHPQHPECGAARLPNGRG